MRSTLLFIMDWRTILSLRFARLFPLQKGTPRQVIGTSLLVSTTLFYILYYLPRTKPSYQIPEFPVLLLLILVTPFLIFDIGKRGFQFLRKPREGLFIYTLGLSQNQRREMVLNEVRFSLSLLWIFIITSSIVLLLLEYTLLQGISVSSFLFLGILALLTSTSSMTLIYLISRGIKSSIQDPSENRVVHSDGDKQAGHNRLILGCVQLLTAPWSGMQCVALKRLWLYVFRERGTLFFLMQSALLIGAFLLMLLLYRAGNQYKIALFLTPLVAALFSLNSALSIISEAHRFLQQHCYYPFSEKEKGKSIQSFALTLLMPYGILFPVLLGIVGFEFSSVLLALNSCLVLAVLLSLFSRLLLSGEGKCGEIPVWYPMVIIFSLLLFLLSWGGSIGLLLLIALLLMWQK